MTRTHSHSTRWGLLKLLPSSDHCAYVKFQSGQVIKVFFFFFIIYFWQASSSASTISWCGLVESWGQHFYREEQSVWVSIGLTFIWWRCILPFSKKTKTQKTQLVGIEVYKTGVERRGQRGWRGETTGWLKEPSSGALVELWGCGG